MRPETRIPGFWTDWRPRRATPRPRIAPGRTIPPQEVAQDPTSLDAPVGWKALVVLAALIVGLYVVGALLCAATDPQARGSYRASSEPWHEVTP